MNGILKAPQAAPVQSVNGKTGAVELNAADVGARPETWKPSAADVGALRVMRNSDFESTNLVEIYRAMPDRSIFMASASLYMGNEANNLPTQYGMITILSLESSRKKMTLNQTSGYPVGQASEEYMAEISSGSTECTWYPVYTGKQLPSPVVGVRELTVTSASIAAGSTGTGSASFSAISGATRYYAALRGAGSVYGWATGTSISGTTLTATFYNASDTAHTIATTFLILGVAE